MEIRFDDKVVLVTGASTGLGAAMAQGFARCGASVLVYYNSSQHAAEEVVRGIEEAGGSAYPVRADLSDPEGSGLLAARVHEQAGGVDVLVNNAGGLVDRRAPARSRGLHGRGSARGGRCLPRHRHQRDPSCPA